jgi:hypothetical protein
MKKIIFTLFCSLSIFVSNAQSNRDIANVYLKRAHQVIEESIDFKEALVQFNKALQHLDTITSAKTAMFGAKINYELQNLEEAKNLASQYFLLEKNTGTEEYLTFLDLKITIDEELEAQIKAKLAEEKRIEEERIKKEKELKKIDSLKTSWRSKSEALSIKVDSIYKFDKNNLALFTLNNYFGIINDNGKVLLKADKYKDVVSFDGYLLFKDKKEEATKIFCYSTNDKGGFLLPNPSDFSTLSTHYGQIMLPRGNGRLVTYPDNSYEPMVFDLASKKIVKVANKQDLFKDLKKNDIIDKYNKEDELKINKVWYSFGGHLGGGVHPLYLDKNYGVHSFLCSIDGTVIDATTTYQYIGSFYNDKLQAIKDGKTLWINQNGTKVKKAKDETGVYTGDIKVVKLDNGSYQFMKGNVIVLGEEKLEKLAVFLRNNSKK